MPPGDKLTVTYGEQVFSPVQYHSFRIGPLTIDTHVRPEETDEEAFLRAYEFLEKSARLIYPRVRREFDERLSARPN